MQQHYTFRTRCNLSLFLLSYALILSGCTCYKFRTHGDKGMASSQLQIEGFSIADLDCSFEITPIGRDLVVVGSLILRNRGNVTKELPLYRPFEVYARVHDISGKKVFVTKGPLYAIAPRKRMNLTRQP